jgi:hypothetical protein
MLRGLSTTASTTQGALGRHTLSSTVTVTTSATSTGILFFFGKCLVSWQSVKQ